MRSASAGDGKTGCKATAQLAGLTQLYQASQNGTLACQQGADVTYPEGAPGFAYDPTGAFASLVPATPSASPAPTHTIQHGRKFVSTVFLMGLCPLLTCELRF